MSVTIPTRSVDRSHMSFGEVNGQKVEKREVKEE